MKTAGHTTAADQYQDDVSLAIDTGKTDQSSNTTAASLSHLVTAQSDISHFMHHADMI